MVTAIEGVVENGKISLRESVSLPENTRVFVIVPDVSAKPVAHVRPPHFVNVRDAVRFQKQVMDIPDDGV
jgi:uncharacterized lipoprotein YbaY